MPRLSDLGEEEVVRRLVAQLTPGSEVLIGPGDDCAAVSLGGGKVELLKTDCLVEGVHFLPETPPSKVGWKAISRTFSDFAAMGGWPSHVLITVALPSDRPVSWVEGLYRGMNKCTAQYGAAIVGGETSSVPLGNAAVISVAATGSVRRKQLVRRSGGRPKDAIYVTGRLGGSLGGRHLNFSPRLEEARWLVDNFPLRAMMDLSDGLARDLPRLAEASECGFTLEEDALPRHRGCSVAQALGDGEDYELLFTLSPPSAKRLEEEWNAHFPTVKLTRIGELTEDGQEKLAGGWEHFSA